MRVKITFPLRHPFHPDWAATPIKVARGRCAVVSGNLWELLEASAARVTVQQAVFVMLYSDTPALCELDRQRLWEIYQVPIYGCLLDAEGRLVGWECEAQDGLHVPNVCLTDRQKLVISSDDSLLGLRVPLDKALIETSPCDCGRPGQRLRFQEATYPERRLVESVARSAASKVG